MIELEENKRLLDELNQKLLNIKDTMKIDSLSKELKSLEEESSQDGFWQDIEHSNKVFSKIKTLQKKISSFNDLKSEIENLIDINDLLEEEFNVEIPSNRLSSEIDTIEELIRILKELGVED